MDTDAREGAADYDSVYRFIRRRVDTREDAEGLTPDVFLGAADALRRDRLRDRQARQRLLPRRSIPGEDPRSARAVPDHQLPVSGCADEIGAIPRSRHNRGVIETSRMHRAPSSAMEKMRYGMGIDSRQGERALNIVECRECGISSGAFWIRWRAYRIDDPELEEPPALAFYCPACSDREFGTRGRNRL